MPDALTLSLIFLGAMAGASFVLAAEPSAERSLNW